MEEFAQKYGDFNAKERLLSATITPAKMMGFSGKAGCIKPGSFADVVAAEVSPWYDITSMEKISFVIKEGNVCKFEP
ncbi:amidohydrolase family protein [Lacrimispora sphenoides]|uniref:amidohydrolase family protein n=1 Tax=Lacrimispora sphenoides TaxID=29370 RepID=UPI00115FAE08|nr:amidohydrolase family protein [Lacrimispora sphenoides]